MGNAAATYLAPTYPDTPSALHNLIFFLGIDHRTGTFRNYSVNPIDSVPGAAPLEAALARLWLRAGSQTQFRAFGTRAEWPGAPDTLFARFAAAIPADARRPLAIFVANLDDALYWWQIAVRNVPGDLRAQVFAVRDLGDTQGDGTKYYPQYDDAAALIDESSLYYAGMKVAVACESLARTLSGLPSGTWPAGKTPVTIETPFGALVVGTPGRDDFLGPALAIVDPGGDDTYHGNVGASIDPDRPFGVVVDIAGNDRYVTTTDYAQGVGIFGAGIVVDWAGDDTYTAANHAQGLGVFGLGVLYDRAGDDKLDMHVSGQGCGYFGVGLCLDGGGKDEYRLWGEGQGHGGVGGGVGVMATYGGDDFYYAEPDAEIAGRADYHSEGKIAANNAQGSGGGRRGDGSDGHAWAGGLGVIIDIGGNDRYESGNWSLGIGYWFGTGIVYDSEGDDVYRSVYFTQASGAHFCNGVMIDEAGNDRHELWFNKGAAIAFGWDYTNALLIDKSGNDLYDGGQGCVAVSSGRSTAILYDGGGDDEYRADAGKEGLGLASPRDDFFKPSPVAPYMYYSPEIGFLIDCGGKDKYLRKSEDGSTTADTLAIDGTIWRNPAADTAKLHGGGFDFPDGTIPELGVWDGE